MCQQPPGIFRQGRRRIRCCGCKDIGTAADVQRLRRQQCSVNVSGALLNGTDDDLPARVHIKSDNEVVAGVRWNQGIEINPSTVLPQKRVIRGVGLNETNARISNDLPAVVQ